MGMEVDKHALSTFGQKEIFLPSMLEALDFTNLALNVPAFTRTILGLYAHHIHFELCPDGTVGIEDYWPTRVPSEESIGKIELGGTSNYGELICHTTTP
jgi:hypothetical protein